MSETVDSMKKTRKYLRSKVTRCYNTVNAQDFIPNTAIITDYKQRFMSLRADLNDLNKSIHGLLSDDEDMDTLLTEEDSYEDKIASSLHLLDVMQAGIPIPSQPSVSNNNVNKLKLPTIELPVFANDKQESLEIFFHSFESILNKHALSDYEKFTYLKGQLSKAPKSLINSLDVNEQTYAIAKKLLLDAFASPITQRYDVIARLSKLKLNLNSDVYEYISEVRSVISSINLLRIDVKTIVQYFVWRSMNDQFQEELIHLTNNSKPDLTQIMDNIFPATERYLRTCNRMKELRTKYPLQAVDSIETNNLAVKIKSRVSRPCIVCVTDKRPNVSHMFRDCLNYKSPVDKVKRLQYYNFCTKCSFSNHSTKDCRFKFSSPCNHCKGAHLSCAQNYQIHLLKLAQSCLLYISILLLLLIKFCCPHLQFL